MNRSPEQRCQLRKSSGTKSPRLQWKIARSTKPGVRLSSAGTAKYRNKPTNGYDSKKEARRAAELKLMQRLGKIKNLKEQVRYELIPKALAPDGSVLEKACFYVCDFQYEFPDGSVRLEDAKGFRTPLFVLKKKIMRFRYGLEVVEV